MTVIERSAPSHNADIWPAELDLATGYLPACEIIIRHTVTVHYLTHDELHEVIICKFTNIAEPETRPC